MAAAFCGGGPAAAAAAAQQQLQHTLTLASDCRDDEKYSISFFACSTKAHPHHRDSFGSSFFGRHGPRPMIRGLGWFLVLGVALQMGPPAPADAAVDGPWARAEGALPVLTGASKGLQDP